MPYQRYWKHKQGIHRVSLYLTLEIGNRIWKFSGNMASGLESQVLNDLALLFHH